MMSSKSRLLNSLAFRLEPNSNSNTVFEPKMDGENTSSGRSTTSSGRSTNSDSDDTIVVIRQGIKRSRSLCFEDNNVDDVAILAQTKKNCPRLDQQKQQQRKFHKNSGTERNEEESCIQIQRSQKTIQPFILPLCGAKAISAATFNSRHVTSKIESPSLYKKTTTSSKRAKCTKFQNNDDISSTSPVIIKFQSVVEKPNKYNTLSLKSRGSKYLFRPSIKISSGIEKKSPEQKMVKSIKLSCNKNSSVHASNNENKATFAPQLNHPYNLRSIRSVAACMQIPNLIKYQCNTSNAKIGPSADVALLPPKLSRAHKKRVYKEKVSKCAKTNTKCLLSSFCRKKNCVSPKRIQKRKAKRDDNIKVGTTTRKKTTRHRNQTNVLISKVFSRTCRVPEQKVNLPHRNMKCFGNVKLGSLYSIPNIVSQEDDSFLPNCPHPEQEPMVPVTVTRRSERLLHRQGQKNSNQTHKGSAVGGPTEVRTCNSTDAYSDDDTIVIISARSTRQQEVIGRHLPVVATKSEIMSKNNIVSINKKCHDVDCSDDDDEDDDSTILILKQQQVAPAIPKQIMFQQARMDFTTPFIGNNATIDEVSILSNDNVDDDDDDDDSIHIISITHRHVSRAAVDCRTFVQGQRRYPSRIRATKL